MMIKNLICFLTLLFLGPNLLAQSESLPVKSLKNLYSNNKEFKNTVDLMFQNVHELPGARPNPWKGKSIDNLYEFLNEWFYFLPNAQNGLDRILTFSFLYYKNPHGMKFITTEPGLSWANSFIKERGKFMDSPESSRILQEWFSDNSIDHEDFILPLDGFTSFNEYFTRDLKPGTRPIDEVEDNSVLVSPADGIINMIANELELDSQIPTKGRMTMSLHALLDSSTFAERFVKGSALAVFLMPNDYHGYHAPVSGEIIESKEQVGERLFGMPDMLDMMNRGNAAYNKDYSVFENFRHGYFIIKTKDHGLIAVIPIGLQTVGSVVFEEKLKNIKKENPKKVYKGEKLGHFAYGGSTVLLIFERAKLNSLTVKQGQRIGKLKN